MESHGEIRPEELPSLPIRGLVELFSSEYQHMAKALRKEVRRRLGVEYPIPFSEFSEAASEFLAADPGDQPRSDWRREFSKRMDGLKTKLEMADWGDTIDKHKWYFCHNPESFGHDLDFAVRLWCGFRTCVAGS